MVAAGGLEPPRVLPQRILNPSCLPIPPRRQNRTCSLPADCEQDYTHHRPESKRYPLSSQWVRVPLQAIEQGELGGLCKGLLGSLQYKALERQVTDRFSVIDVL